MKKNISLFAVVSSLVLLFNSLAMALDPKAMVEEIFETKEVTERAVRAEKWADADSSVTILEKQMKELVSALKVSNPEGVNKKISLISAGMHKAIAEKEDEEYEDPANAMMDQLLQLMSSIDYGKPAVFVIIQRQIEESLELVEEGHWESLEEEMEEIVNVRAEARSSAKKAGINPDKVNVILDLAWDVSRDADAKNSASAQKRLERMKSIIETM